MTREPVDPGEFAALVDAALVAFATDDRYAVRIARRATWLQENRRRRADLARRHRERPWRDVSS